MQFLQMDAFRTRLRFWMFKLIKQFYLQKVRKL